MRKATLFFAALFISGAALAQEGATTRLIGPISSSQYPLALGDRPLVLPNLMLEGTTDFEHFKLAPGLSTSGIGLRVGLGIADVVQIDALSTILVDPTSEWSKVLGARIAFLAYDSRELDIAPSLYVPFDFHDGADLVSQARVGAETRFRFNRAIYAYGLRDLLVFDNAKIGGEKKLQVGLNGTFGAGLEPIEHLSLELEATLFHLKVSGDAEASKVIFTDNIPVAVKALFALNRQLDLFGQITLNDLKNGTDSLTFVGGLNARL